jgi:hypothetical protein
MCLAWHLLLGKELSELSLPMDVETTAMKRYKAQYDVNHEGTKRTSSPPTRSLRKLFSAGTAGVSEALARRVSFATSFLLLILTNQGFSTKSR